MSRKRFCIVQVMSLLLTASMTSCRSLSPSQPGGKLRDDEFVGMTEQAVRVKLGGPDQELPRFYGNPPRSFTDHYQGEVKTLVFKKVGGEYYVAFENLGAGWTCICSSWLPDGAEF
jgi:hypothetical protein